MTKTRRTLFSRALDAIERVGNALPHPATLFLLLAVLVALVSWAGAMTSLQATHPVDQSTISVRNLLSWEGLRWTSSCPASSMGASSARSRTTRT